MKRVMKYGLLDKGQELLCDIRLVLLVGLKLLTGVKIKTASPGCHGDLEYRTWACCWCSMCYFNIFGENDIILKAQKTPWLVI